MSRFSPLFLVFLAGCNGIHVESAIGGNARQPNETDRLPTPAASLSAAATPNGAVTPLATQTPKDSALALEKTHKADEAASNGDFNAAFARYTEATALDPGAGAAWAGLAKIQEQRQNFALAVKDYDKALTCADAISTWRDSRDADARLAGQHDILEAKAAYRDGSLDKGSALYKEADGFMPDSGMAQREWGITLFENERYPEALDHFRLAVQRSPEDVLAWEWGVKAAVKASLTAKAQEMLTGFKAHGGDPDAAAQLATLIGAGGTALPDSREMDAIKNKIAIDKGDLASILAAQLPLSGPQASGSGPPVVLDVEDHWARKSILACVGANLLPVDPAHNFHPDYPVLRGEMARTVVTALKVFKVFDTLPPQTDRPFIEDVNFANLFYADVSFVVNLEIMRLFPDNTFRLTDTLTGKETLEIVAKLREMVRGQNSP